MRSPQGKADLLNRLFSYDFTGDWRTLGEGVRLNRVKPHVAQLYFPENGRMFELVVRIPRAETKAKKQPKNVALGQAPPAPADDHDGHGKQERRKRRRTLAHH